MTSHEQRAQHAETVRMTLTISNCLFWELDAGWVGGGARVVDVWPLQMTIEDSQFMNNYALVSSAINYAIYSRSFDPGTGVHGDTRTFLKRVEVAEDQATSIRYTDPTLGRWTDPDENRLHWGGKRYHQQPIHWIAFAGHWAESENWNLFVDIEDYYHHDIRNSQQPGLTFINIGRCNCGCLRVSVRDTRIENSKGDYNSQWQGATFVQFGQTVEIVRTSFVGNGVDSQTDDGASTGVVVLRLSEWGVVRNSEFIGGVSGSGSGILFETTGWLEIRDSLFRGNSAWNAGGAVTHNAGDLMVINSVFDSNIIPQNREGDTVEVIVYLYTGYTGTGPGEISGYSDNELLPVWKIDGNNPNEYPSPPGCQQPQEQTAWVIRDGLWYSNSPKRYPPAGGPLEPVCQDGSVPADETVYGNLTYPTRSFQSQVVRLTVGMHRLWHGVIANNPHPATGWGDGYIAIVDILPPILPQVVDNRMRRDENGVIRQEGCATNTRTDNCPPLFDRKDPQYEDCINFCRDGETFWSYTDFDVPWGIGAGINVQVSQKVLIADCTFASNVAGKGTAVFVAAAEEFTVVNTTYVEADFDGMGDAGSRSEKTISLGPQLTQSVCIDTPCDPGFSCEFSMLSLRCDPCAFNEFGTDGVRCAQCSPGTEPNANKTACMPCPSGMHSSLGFCEYCEAGTTSSDDHVSCVECVNSIRAVHELECHACEPGKSPSPGQTSCTPCYYSGSYSSDGISCETCSNGQQPFFNQSTGLATGCEPCPAGTAGTDGECKSCEPGTKPSDDKISCQDCPATTFSRDGFSCDTCEPGFAPNADAGADSCMPCHSGSVSVSGERCVPCPERQTASSDRTQCFCIIQTYNQVVFGSITCHGLIDSTYGPTFQDTCAHCPLCLNCDAGSTVLKPGWAFFGVGEAYRCPVPDGCQGGPLLNGSLAKQLWSREETGKDYSVAALSSQCSQGYTGPVCGNCDVDFHHLRVGRPCLPCEDGVVDIPVLLGVVFIAFVLGGIVISGAYKVLVDHGVTVELRLLVGFYQLLGQMDSVMSISFPSPVPQFIKIISLLFVDIRKFVNMDCWDIGGFEGKLVTNVFVIPIIFACACILLYMNERRTIGTVIAAGGADASAYRSATISLQQNAFFCIFLLYPTINATLFRVPQCTLLGTALYHEEDYTVDCQSGRFYFMMALSIGLIVAIPVGVPATFLFLMNKARLKLPDGRVNTTLLGGAKLVPDSTDDNKDSYGFLCRDCKPEYWYYEIVTYARKLLLGGLSIAVGRGTMAQGYFVATCEAAFLMHHVRVFPYVRAQHNRVDAIGHFVIILTYTVALILRNNEAEFENERFPKEGYGWFITFLYTIVLPGPTIYHFCSNNGKAYRDFETTENDWMNTFENPLDGGGRIEERVEMDATANPAASTSIDKLAKMQRKGFELFAENQKLKQLLANASHAPATTVATNAAETPDAIARWKELTEDEYLSEETRVAAKENIEQAIAHELALAKATESGSFGRKEAQLETLEAFRTWLAKHRLLNYESAIMQVCGPYVTVDDFPFMSKKDHDAITNTMTHVEKARFEAALSSD